jgi:septum site-determining protein MinC
VESPDAGTTANVRKHRATKAESSSSQPSIQSSVELWHEPDAAAAVDFSQASEADWEQSESDEEATAQRRGPIIREDTREKDWERLQHNSIVVDQNQSEAETAPPGPWDEDILAEEVLKEMYPKEATSGLNRGNEALLIKTTCRSGEVIRYAGDVVVFADVNPGSEIIADGDIVVFGALRGLAHAGAGGDVQSTITAIRMETHRLQIGPYTGVSPKANQRSKSNRISPKIAYVRRRGVYVAPFAGRFAGYSGGTPYGG